MGILVKDDLDYQKAKAAHPALSHAFRCGNCGLVMFYIPQVGCCDTEDCMGDIDKGTIRLKRIEEIEKEIV